jgi:hypothetical protein
MIGTTGATIVILVKVLVACVLGIGAGGFTCLALRLSWRPKEALIDAVLTTVVTVATAYVVAAIDIPRGVWESRDGLILAIAVGSVVVRHFVRLALRSAHK